MKNNVCKNVWFKFAFIQFLVFLWCDAFLIGFLWDWQPPEPGNESYIVEHNKHVYFMTSASFFSILSTEDFNLNQFMWQF